MTTVYVLTVHDGDSSSTTIHPTQADAEATLRANYDQEPADYAHLTGDELIIALEDRDGLEIALSAVESELPAFPTVDDLIEPRRIPVWLNSEDIGLLRAGLAAHSIALQHADNGVAPEDRVRIYKQRDDCRTLSIRLGDTQIQLDKAGA